VGQRYNAVMSRPMVYSTRLLYTSWSIHLSDWCLGGWAYLVDHPHCWCAVDAIVHPGKMYRVYM